MKRRQKKTTPPILALALIIFTGFANPVKAQDHKKEMIDFAKEYENAYNVRDTATLMSLYLKDAEEITLDGTTIKGIDAIRASMRNQFENETVKIKVIADKCITKSDGSVAATGTYYVTGLSLKGEKIEGAGAFSNILVKRNGRWKISKSVLTKM